MRYFFFQYVICSPNITFVSFSVGCEEFPKASLLKSLLKDMGQRPEESILQNWIEFKSVEDYNSHNEIDLGE